MFEDLPPQDNSSGWQECLIYTSDGRSLANSEADESRKRISQPVYLDWVDQAPIRDLLDSEDMVFESPTTIEFPSVIDQGVDETLEDTSPPCYLNCLSDEWLSGTLFEQVKRVEESIDVREMTTFSRGLSCTTCTTEPTSSSSTVVSTPISNRLSTLPQDMLSLSPHKVRIDPIRHPKLPTQEPIDLPQCEECNRSFRYRKDVERHKLSVHLGLAKWFCPMVDCKYSTQGFSRKDKASQHIRTHRRNPGGTLVPMPCSSGDIT